MTPFFVRSRIARASARIVTAHALLAAAVLSAGAQVAVDVGPLVGYYRPTGRFDPQSVYSTSLPNSPEELSGLALGAEATVRFRSRFGIRAEGAGSFTSVGEVETPGEALNAGKFESGRQTDLLLHVAMVWVP